MYEAEKVDQSRKPALFELIPRKFSFRQALDHILGQLGETKVRSILAMLVKKAQIVH